MNNQSSMPSGVSLSVHGLCKSYNGHAVLQGVSLEVKAGEIFVIIGPSGSGKSVLLRLLIGLENADQGEVLVDGRRIQSPETTTRYRMAMVFQSSALLTSMTVGENVGFYLAEHQLKPPAEIAAIIATDLAEVGLPGKENEMPAELSGGMQKRVAIARALAVEPQLIFYDEPTSGLDPVSSVNIVEDIVKLNQRIHATTLIVTHDRELAFGIGQHIAMLDEGRIIALGTAGELKGNPDPQLRKFLSASIGQIMVAPADPALTAPE